METTMNKQRAAQLYELTNRLSKLDVKSLSEQQKQQRNRMIAKLKEEVTTIKEFSPSDEDGGENEDLYNYAKMWYNGDMSTQEDVEKALDLIGWEIGEIESEEGGAFIIKSGDENGDTYMSFTPEDLSEGSSNNMSETMSDCTCSSKIVDPKCPLHGTAERKMSGGTGSSDNNQSLRTWMDKRAELANRKVPAMAEDFNGEYDDEAGMAKSNLRTMARAVNGLLDTIEDNDNLPEWAQEKLAKAEMMTTSVWDYLLSQKEQGMDPKVQSVAEVQLTPMWQDNPEHLEYLKKKAEISRSTGLAVGDRVTLKDRPGFKGKIVHDWGGGDFTISGAGGGMSQSNNHRANARLIQKIQGVTEGSQQVDSLVTDALKIMRGSDYQVDAVKAIKTVLGDREYNSRRGFYSFYVRQLMDMHGQEGIAETKKSSPKLTAVNIKKSDTVSEEINKEAYERLQKVFDFSNYKG